MKLSLRLKHAARRALALLPLLLACHLAPVFAGPVPPSAESTLDVCQDEISGNWRYSGVVAVAGKSLSQDSVIGIDFKIQNQVSTGYADALRAPRLADDPGAAGTSARVARFSVDAAPLLLGTLRNASRVVISDPLNLAATPIPSSHASNSRDPFAVVRNPPAAPAPRATGRASPALSGPRRTAALPCSSRAA